MSEEKERDSRLVIECLREMLSRMGVEGAIEEGVVGDTTTYIIRTREAGILIGEDGQNLAAFNHLLRKIIEKQSGPEATPFLLDVNDYQRHRFEEIKERARMGAQRVRYFKKEVVLQPMSAFDRRVVHLALQEYPDITTESVGEGAERRIVIKPYP